MDKKYELLENFEYVQSKIRDEGFHYCFKHFSRFEEIDDKEFHRLRKKYLKISEELEKYVISKINSINEEIDNID